MSKDLRVENLVVEFASGDYKIRPLNGLTFSANDGELVVLLGPSGCGKTTLLSCLAGLLTPTAGEIEFQGIRVDTLHGADVAKYRQLTAGIIFQAFNLIPSLLARSNVAIAMRLAKIGRRQSRKRADELLALVGLADRGHHRPSELSGGQQQRVAIARALVHDPPLLLADEPTAHLDHIQVEGVLRLLRRLATAGRIVVVSTHDDRVTHIADRVIPLVSQFSDADREPEIISVKAGSTIFRQGDPSDLIYLIQSGSVEIIRIKADDSEENLAILNAGNYFGELGPILNFPRSAEARAIDDVELLAMSVRSFRRSFPGAAGSVSTDDPVQVAPAT